MSQQTAKQRAALYVLGLMARYPPTSSPTDSASDAEDLMNEIAKIELGLRRTAVVHDARTCKALGRETGRQVRMRRIKGAR